MGGDRTHRRAALWAGVLLFAVCTPVALADRALPEEPGAARFFDLLRGVSPLPGDLRARGAHRAPSSAPLDGVPGGSIRLDRLLGAPRRLYAGDDGSRKIRVSGPLGTVLSPAPNAPGPAVEKDWLFLIDALESGKAGDAEVEAALTRIRKDPAAAEDSRTHLMRGLVAFARGEEGNAREAFKAAARASGSDLPARMLLGLLLLSADEAESALEPLGEAAKIAPKNPAVRELLAEAQVALGRLQPAIRNLEAVLAAEPDSARSRLLLAQCLLRARRPRDALSHLEALEGAESLRFRIECLTARALLRLKRPKDAGAHALRAEKLRPDEILPRTVRLSALLADGRTEDAQSLAAEIAGAFPEKPAAWWAQTAAAEARNDLEAAEKAARRWLSLAERAPGPPLALARILIAAGRPGEAVPLLAGLLERTPGSAAAHRLLARAHLAAKRPEEARKSLEAFLRLVPKGPAADEARKALEDLPRNPK